MNLSGIDRHQPVPAKSSQAKLSQANQPGDRRERKREKGRERERLYVCASSHLRCRLSYQQQQSLACRRKVRSFFREFPRLATTLAVIRSRCLFHEGKRKNESSPLWPRYKPTNISKAVLHVCDVRYVRIGFVDFSLVRALGDLSPAPPVMHLC